MDYSSQPPTSNSGIIRQLLEQYLGRHVMEYVMGFAVDDEQGISAVSVYATVMFADIRSFTTISEGIEPLELFRQISDYFDMMTLAVEKHGGSVISFGGDSILAVFGAFDGSTDHELCAVQASAEIMDQLAILNEARMKEELQPFRVGIGANAGKMTVGNLGSSTRVEFTVLGDCVNTAKRLSDLSKEMPFYSIFVTESCLDGAKQCGLSDRWEAFDMGLKEVKGKTQPVPTFAIAPPE